MILIITNFPEQPNFAEDLHTNENGPENPTVTIIYSQVELRGYEKGFQQYFTPNSILVIRLNLSDDMCESTELCAQLVEKALS